MAKSRRRASGSIARARQAPEPVAPTPAVLTRRVALVLVLAWAVTWGISDISLLQFGLGDIGVPPLFLAYVGAWLVGQVALVALFLWRASSRKPLAVIGVVAGWQLITTMWSLGTRFAPPLVLVVQPAPTSGWLAWLCLVSAFLAFGAAIADRLPRIKG